MSTRPFLHSFLRHRTAIGYDTTTEKMFFSMSAHPRFRLKHSSPLTFPPRVMKLHIDGMRDDMVFVTERGKVAGVVISAQTEFLRMVYFFGRLAACGD